MTFHYVPPPSYRPHSGQEAKLTVLQLFRMGMGTDRIAEIKGMEEHQVYNLLSRAREKERQQIQQLKALKG